VTPEGKIVLLGTLEQTVSPLGTVVGHRGELDSKGRIFSGHPDDENLREGAALVAAAAGQAGYEGPAGVDAFVFTWPQQAEHDPEEELRRTLHPVVEFNARFTLGTVVIGLVRRCRKRVETRLGLRPGDRRAFAFRIDAPHGGWDAALARAGEHADLVPLARAGDAVQPALLFATEPADIDRALPKVAAQ
jgi:hypothetical protein